MKNVRRAAALIGVLAGTAALAPAAHAAPKRVAALTPFAASTVTQLGVRPVAVGQSLGGSDPAIASLKGVPVLKLSHPNGPNLEQLAVLNPQLVLTTPTFHRGVPAIQRLGIRVVESEPRSVAGLADETRRIGKLLGRNARAKRLAGQLERSTARARRGIRRHPSVLVILGVGRASYAFLANSWGGDVVRQAGGRLLTGGLRASGGFARISNEFVVKRDPDVIIAVPHGNPGQIPKLARYLRTNPAWRGTKAARRGRIFVSTGNSLLQPYPDVGTTIANIRRNYLKN